MWLLHKCQGACGDFWTWGSAHRDAAGSREHKVDRHPPEFTDREARAAGDLTHREGTHRYMEVFHQAIQKHSGIVLGRSGRFRTPRVPNQTADEAV